MTFQEIINQAASSAGSQHNVLTDGQSTCSYQMIPSIFESIKKYFAEKSISFKDCLALRCDNSIPSALILLFMLSEGYSFVLLPFSRSRKKSYRNQAIPRFCRHLVGPVNPLVNKTAAYYRNPKNFLCIIRNEQFNCKQEGPASIGQKLYLGTSGSIGLPKMAAHSHVKLLANALNCVERFRLERHNRIAIPIPIFHMYGLGAAFLPGIAVGASIDLQENSNILRFMERETQFNPTTAFLTPTFCEMLLKGQRSSRSYALVVTAGDRMKEKTFLNFESRYGSLLNLYGSTEMGAIAASSPGDPVDWRALTVGKPMSGVQMQLHKTSLEDNVDTTHIGELCCKHEYGFEGYVNGNGEMESQGMTTRPAWFQTGDLGRIHNNGHIEVLGRCDYSANRNGFLVLFADIEKTMEMIGGIERVAVVAKGESRWGRRIVAFCIVSQGHTLNSAQIRRASFDVLPRYAIPDNIFIASSLPTLPNGKIDRPALVGMVPEEYEGG